MSKVPKEMRPMVRAACDQGWTFTEKGRHAKLTAPDGSYAIPLPGGRVSKDLHRSITCKLRAHGLDWNGK